MLDALLFRLLRLTARGSTFASDWTLSGEEWRAGRAQSKRLGQPSGGMLSAIYHAFLRPQHLANL